MKKYICIGGSVVSQSDGQQHFISATRLPMLYGIDPQSCYYIQDLTSMDRSGLRHREGLIWLLPDQTGEYKLPSKEEDPEEDPEFPEFLDPDWEPSILSIIFWIVFAISIIYLVLGVGNGNI